MSYLFNGHLVTDNCEEFKKCTFPVCLFASLFWLDVDCTLIQIMCTLFHLYK